MGMSRIERGKRALQKAEEALQQIIADAATNGDYQSLPTLTRWVRTLADLLDLDAGAAAPEAVLPSSRLKPKRSTNRSKIKKANGYPRFVRDEDCLVKIGWSKRDNSEYEHKARKDVMRAVVASISRAGQRGERFTMEEVLPINNLDGTSIPDYQTYLILAWLRSIELVAQHGRLGYTTPQQLDLSDAVEDCWNRLASRSTTNAPGIGNVK